MSTPVRAATITLPSLEPPTLKGPTTMCTDCPDPRPDIVVLRTAQDGKITFSPRSAAADAFLARKFAQVEGDLTPADCQRIIAQARALGFVVVVEVW